MTKTPSPTDTALGRLNRFSRSEWSHWIRSLLDGAPNLSPRISLDGATPDRVLIWLFENGLDMTANFVEAVGRVYEGSTTARPRQVFYLLQAIAVIRPEICKESILRHLKEHRFERKSYGIFRLEPIALATRARYGMTDDLRHFVKYSMIRSRDFQYRITCFKTLADSDWQEACRFLDLVLAELIGTREQKIFGGLLRGLAWRESCWPLFQWYNSSECKVMTNVEPAGIEYFEEVLRRWVVPWAPKDLMDDPYAVLLSAQVHAGLRPFTAQELMFIATTTISKGIYSQGHVSDTLRIVWDLTCKKMENWCSWDPLPGGRLGCLPWFYSSETSHLYTYWRSEFLDAKSPPELAKQNVLFDDKVDDRIIVAISRGRRVTPPKPLDGEQTMSFEERFDAMLSQQADAKHAAGG